ncbi:MAG: hypothetical protein ABF290_16560 [Thiogranum sp.]
MDACRKRLHFMLLLGAVLLGLNTLAVVTGKADTVYGCILPQSDVHRDAGGGV